MFCKPIFILFKNFFGFSFRTLLLLIFLNHNKPEAFSTEEVVVGACQNPLYPQQKFWRVHTGTHSAEHASVNCMFTKLSMCFLCKFVPVYGCYCKTMACTWLYVFNIFDLNLNAFMVQGKLVTYNPFTVFQLFVSVLGVVCMPIFFFRSEVVFLGQEKNSSHEFADFSGFAALP